MFPLSQLLRRIRRRLPPTDPTPSSAPTTSPPLPGLGLVGEPFPLEVPEALLGLCAEFHARGHWLLLVGGSVRDLLLGRTPSSSWDLATSATLYQVSRICRAAVFEDTSHTEFTLAFVTHEGHKLEITPFCDRHEYQWTRGPNPLASPRVATLAQDLHERDFTINAIAYDPIGRVLFDPFDGREDLGRRLVRSFPEAEARFRNDPVRVLRGIRISVKLGFEIAPETRAAMSSGLDGARHDPRRNLMELVRLLCGPHPSSSLALLQRMGHLAWVCPALAEVAEERDPWDPERTLFARFSQVLDRLSPATTVEAMGALAAACIVREVPEAPWETLTARHGEALRRAFDERLARLLAPMLAPESRDDAVWWVATFGLSERDFMRMLASAQCPESAWMPAQIVGWPRLADAWWGARAEADEAPQPASDERSREE